MGIYQTFIATTPEEYSADWSSFVMDLPHILLEDRKLKKLFLKYPFFYEKSEEITIEFADEIRDEFEYWVYYLDKEEYPQAEFYTLIYTTVNLIFKELLTKYVPVNIQRITDAGYSSIITIDDIRTFEDDSEDFEDASGDDVDAFDLSEIKNAEVEFTNFSFGKKRLLKIFRDWNSSSIIRPIRQLIKRTPLIKTVNYFDPTIYEVIKKDPNLLKSLDWRLFEEMLADMLRRFKYSVELTQPTKDGGIDIIAIKKDENFGEHKYLLQAKRYSDAVQVSPVRELLFLHDEYNATKSCLATTATFTSGAWKLADKYKWKMELKDQQGILSWINKITAKDTL